MCESPFSSHINPSPTPCLPKLHAIITSLNTDTEYLENFTPRVKTAQPCLVGVGGPLLLL